MKILFVLCSSFVWLCMSCSSEMVLTETETKVHLLLGNIGHAETLVRSPRRWSVKPCLAGKAPLPFPHGPLHWSGLYIYIGSALWNIGRILRRPASLDYLSLLRYQRALCLGRQDYQILRISQASNVKKPTLFIVMSWIVGIDEGHDSVIQSVYLFCHRTSTSATLCQYMFRNITTSSPKLCQLTSVLPIIRVIRQYQNKGNMNTKQEEFLHF